MPQFLCHLHGGALRGRKSTLPKGTGGNDLYMTEAILGDLCADALPCFTQTFNKLHEANYI